MFLYINNVNTFLESATKLLAMAMKRMLNLLLQSVTTGRMVTTVHTPVTVIVTRPSPVTSRTVFVLAS